MKIVKPTFESLLEELDEIYVRFEDARGTKALVAGGINKNGIWTEFSFSLSSGAGLYDIIRCLQAMVHLIEEERKQWHLEESHHFFLREIGTYLN